MLVVVLVSVMFIGFMIFLIQGPPFVASQDRVAKDMMELARGIKPNRIIDLGSGDGKLVILLAKQGHKVDGLEINPILVWRSKRAIRKAGLSKNAKIKWGNFWKADISKYDLVMLYAIKHVMPKLEVKINAELPKGAHIISNFFAFPNLKAIKSIGKAILYKVQN